MKCPYCELEMKKGEVQIGSWGLLGNILRCDEIILWAPEEERKKMAPKGAVHLQSVAEGYYCEKCVKVIAVYDKKEERFW